MGSRLVGLCPQKMLRQAPADLRNLDRVLLARVENVCLTGSHDLRDAGQPLKSGRIEQPIAITLKFKTLVFA